MIVIILHLVLFWFYLKVELGNSQVKDNKSDLLVQQYSSFARFNTIITSLKALDKGFSSKNYVRKFLSALHPIWRAKVTENEESKDLSSLALDDLIDNLKVHEVVMEKDSEIYKGKKERVKSIALKAKKESSDDETSTSRSNQEKKRIHFDRGMRRKEKMTENDLGAVIQIISLAIIQNHLVTKINRPSLEFLGAIAKMKLKTKLTMKLVSWLNHQMSGKEDGNTASVPTASTNVPTASASIANISQDTTCAYIASQSSGSQIKFEDINQIDEDDMEEMDIKWNMTLLSMRAYKPSPTIESTSENNQNRNPSVSETVASPITSKPFIKFVKPKDSQSDSKTDKKETPKKPPVKYVEQYRKPNMKPKARGNQRNWNNLKSQQLAHSYTNRPVHRTLAVRSPSRAPWVLTVNKNYSPVNRKFSTGSRNFPTANRKFPTASRKFPTGSTKSITADMGLKGKAHNMYSIDLNNIVSHRDLTCLVARASADECMLWHMRLGHLNFKTMNKLVRHYLVRGLPTKCFENDHTCTACLKGKQHKASWIKREFSNVRTPQQNGVAERRNRTLIEAARTMLADAKLPVTFWAEAVNTACYVQNKCLGVISVTSLWCRSYKLWYAYHALTPGLLPPRDFSRGVKAFLNGTIDKEVYVMQPPGFQDPAFPGKVYKVEKAMYGLHQAPRACYADNLKPLCTKISNECYGSLNTFMDKENPWGKDGTRKDTIVATSTTEAEYVAAASCRGQVLWIQNQLLDYGYNFMNTKIYIDNNSAICIVKNPVYHSETKHIEIKHHFIRHCYEKKLISEDHIHTDENVADLLTKAFDTGKF
nr:putative ribonuclease H-like domain-containing protein [Tanacetum cinerariifolium]